jgi:predicted site-specific integrase-resolvase
MPNKPQPPKGWLWSQEAADYLGVHVVTLHGWRRDGVAPKSTLHGQRRYAYKISDLDAWLNGDRAGQLSHSAA